MQLNDLDLVGCQFHYHFKKNAEVISEEQYGDFISQHNKMTSNFLASIEKRNYKILFSVIKRIAVYFGTMFLIMALCAVFKAIQLK